jgi:hypothetical protein
MVSKHPYKIDEGKNIIQGGLISSLTPEQITQHLPDEHSIHTIEKCNCWNRTHLDTLDEGPRFGLYISKTCNGFYVEKV